MFTFTTKPSACFLSLIIWASTNCAFAQDIDRQFSTADLRYLGAFRLPLKTFGESRLGYTNGKIAIDSDKGTFFIVGHSQPHAIAEFQLVEPSKASELAELPMAPDALQPFKRFFDLAPSGNPEGINTVTGLELLDGQLIINAAAYYDGSSSNQDTTLILENSNNISSSKIDGYIKMAGKVHSAGWLSKIPAPYREILGGDYIAGHASNIPINGRLSIGPSAFITNAQSILSSKSSGVIETEALLDFSIDNQLYPDLREGNALWSELSEAVYGFIVPGTKSYLTIGSTGGVYSGIGYKITQDTGYLCGGYCPREARDYYNSYWLWDLNDLIAVKMGEKQPYDLRPVEFGELNLPFKFKKDGYPALIGGVDYDEKTNRLYILLKDADYLQSQYERAPVMLVYEIATGSRPLPPKLIETAK